MDDLAPHLLGFNGPADHMYTCDDGKPLRLPDGTDWIARRRTHSMARSASLTFARPRVRTVKA